MASNVRHTSDAHREHEFRRVDAVDIIGIESGRPAVHGVHDGVPEGMAVV